VAVWAITEALSVFGTMRRVPLAVAWVVVLCVAVRRKGRALPMPRFDWVVTCYVAGCTAILALTALAAGFSPPNSADAMAYHMPRVLYWAEQGGVRFFPTAYLNQIMLQPFAEYVMLHIFVLTGGDHFVNYVQWTASVGSVIAVSSIAREFGAPARAQAFAALFCATIPLGILASSGAKNDYVLALWLACAVYFALRWRRSGAIGDAALLGCALGLALLTKATAYLFAPWPLLAILARPAFDSRKTFWRAALCIGGCALAINLPHYIRNYGLSGSPFGYDAAFGTEQFRWRNETLGLKPTLSNALRNATEQLGRRSDGWNRAVFETSIVVQRRLGIDPDSPATTWPGTIYRPPRNANHEADAPNPLHLAILGVLLLILVWRASRGSDRLMALYAVSLVAGFLAFCFYLKWQPFMARLFLPLFVLGAPLASMVRPLWAQTALCFLLLDSARLPALENWVRPLRGERSVFRVTRDQQYFSDMVQWREDWPSYWLTVDALAKTNCGTIGIDSNHFQLEYPLEALLRERKPSVQFVHAGVSNASVRYAPPVAERPCAMVCLHCEHGGIQAGSFTVTFTK
jgi:hypothetical protein